ncbi:MAG: triose-phosphate isomerase [Solirubrobacterales bacterium]|nr:triose-phosphate isomerase [Solirubrobacterales bacterium]
MADRTPLMAANWKLHKTVAEAEAYLAKFLPGVPEDGVEVVVCPPFTALAACVEGCAATQVRIAAQNMHEAESGAFTGEVSAPMLSEIGVEAVVLGHSERRTYFGELDEALALKVPAALRAGLLPILCVGETGDEREHEQTEKVLRRQIELGLIEVDDDQLAEVVIAYEPIWAIGTGRTAAPEQAQEAVAFIRELLAERYPDEAGDVRILYGGSVKPDNATELMAQADIDGALVGGASLDPEDFAAIVAAAT